MSVRLVVLLCFSFVLTVAQDDLITKASKLKEAEKYEEAVALLKEGYASIVKDPKGLLVLAECAVMAGLYDDAIQPSAKAVELDAQNPNAHRVAAQAFLGRAEEAKQERGASASKIEGYYEEALGFAEGMLKLKSDSAEGHSLKGNALFWLNRPADSAKAYAEAAKLEPGNDEHVVNAARSYSLANQHAEAIALYERAIKTKPEESWLHLALGDAHAQLKANEKACNSYVAALTAKNLDDQSMSAAPQRIWGILGTANKFAEADGHIQKWIQAQPQLPVAHWWHGFYLSKLNKNDEALSAFIKAFDVSGKKYAIAATDVGSCEFNAGRHDVAIDWWAKAQTLLSANDETDGRARDRFLAAMIGPSITAGELEKAIGWLERYEKNAPADTSIFNTLGLCYRDSAGGRGARGAKAKERYEKSRDWYEKATAQVLKDKTADGTRKAQTINDTGLIYHYYLDNIAKGVEHYKKALSFDGEYGDALENLGLCMNILGKHEEAVGLFEKVLRKEPGRVVSVRGLAEAKKGLAK